MSGAPRDLSWWAGIALAVVIGFFAGSWSGLWWRLNAESVSIAAKERASLDGQLQRSKVMLQANKERLAKLDGLESTVVKLRDESAMISDSIEAKRQALRDISNKFDVIKSNPVNMPAGHFVAGRDISPGRYAVSGDHNLVIYSGSGELKVNTILGPYGVDRYVCDIDEGDIIKAQGADSFYPVD